MKNNFIGYWQLEKWFLTYDGAFHSHPFGADAKGELLYSDSGRMFASLMKADRTNFEKSSLMRASEVEQQSAIESYISYSGTFRVLENKVIHTVEFSLLPNWKGTELTRYFQFSEDKKQLTLTTAKETSKKGGQIQNHLVWKKIN